MKKNSESSSVAPGGYEEVTERRKVYTIKEAPVDDRPQERALAHGVGSLPVADLLALVLRSGQPGKPVTKMTRELMEMHHQSLHELQRSPRENLMRVKGMGLVKALQVEALCELIRRYCTEDIPERPQIRMSSDVFDIMGEKIGNLHYEQIWALFLNRRNEVTHLHCVTQGTAVASVFDSKMVIREALFNYAEGVILCHNHPSGNLKPSVQDDNLTRKFADACKALELSLLDHVIVTARGFYSYRDQGKL